MTLIIFGVFEIHIGKIIVDILRYLDRSILLHEINNDRPHLYVYIRVNMHEHVRISLPIM